MVTRLRKKVEKAIGVSKSSKKQPKSGASRTTFDSWASADIPKSRQSSMQSFLAPSGGKGILVRSPPTTVTQATPDTPPTPAPASLIHSQETPPPESASVSLESQSSVRKSHTSKMRMINTRGETNRQESSEKVFQQMYLDLGQRNFAKRTLCCVCGMMYDAHGAIEDIEQHNKVCKDYIHGVPFQASQARVVAEDDASSIVEIRPSDSLALRKKVVQVRTIVDDELGYVASDSDTALRSAYLYIRKRRVVGLVTAEVIERGYALQNNFERSKHPQKAMIGIHHMWVHSRFRKQGIATRLVDAVRKKMVFGLVVPPERLAFSSPTEAGVKFARRYVNHASRGESSKDVLVYECS